MAARAYERDGGLSGLATGLDDLDRMMGGLQPSDLVILAGRPAMGKTALATNIAFNIAKAYAASAARRRDQGRRRRHRRLLLARNVVRAARDPHHRRAGGRPLLQDPPRRHHRKPSSTASPRRRARCRRIPLYIDQTGGISIAQLAARARRLKRQQGLDVLVVDYLQLLAGVIASARRRTACRR